MKKCTHIENSYIEKYVLNLLSEKEERQFQEHLLECEECFSKLQSVRKLATLLSDIESNVENNIENIEKKPAIIHFFLKYSAAASIILLVGAGAYLFFKPDHSEIVAVEMEDSVGKDTIDTIVSEIEYNPDMLAQEAGKDILETKTGGEKEKSGIEKEPQPDNQPVNVKQAPHFAKNDSVAPDNTSAQEVSFKMLNPENKETTVFLKNDAENKFEFRWQVDKPAFTVLLIKVGSKILDEFKIKDKNNFEIDLSEYAQFKEIEWVLMVGDSENRKQGKIIFKK
jgi:hypothetical protein